MHFSTFSGEEPAVSKLQHQFGLALDRAGSLADLAGPRLEGRGAGHVEGVAMADDLLVGALYFSSRLARGSTRMIWRFISASISCCARFRLRWSIFRSLESALCRRESL